MERANRVGVETATWSPWSKIMNKTHGGNIWKIAKENGLRPADIIDFSASINPLGPSPRAMDAIKTLNRSGSGKSSATLLCHYPEPQAESMKSELALFHKLPEENILAGNGSTQFIYLIPQVLKPKSALIIEPAFSEYRNSLIANHCTVDEIVLREEDDFCLDRDRLFDALKKGYDAEGSAYDILYLGNPANPTGVMTDKRAIIDIATECKKYGTFLVVDEAFIDFVEEYSVKAEAVLMDNLIVLRSMTKFFAMPGLRLGYIIAHKNIIKQFEKFVPPWSVNTLAIVAGIESLRDKDYIRMTRERLMSEAASFKEGSRTMPYFKAYPSPVNYFLVKILLEGVTASALREELLNEGVIIRDCSTFIGLGSTFFRAAIRNEKENQYLIYCINKMLINLKK